MRSVLIALLLAGIATPAIAEDFQFRTRGERGERRPDDSASDAPRERQQRGAERRDQPADSDSSERRSGNGRSESLGGGGATSTQGGRDQGAGDAVGNWRRQQVVETTAVEPPRDVESRIVRRPREGGADSDVQRGGADGVRRWRTRDRDGDPAVGSIEERNLRRAPGSPVTEGGLVQTRRPLPGVFDRRERRVSRTPVLGTEPPAPRTATNRLANPAHRWSTDWRRDRRYDWRDWRRRHRRNFHFGFYYDPFGWDYFRYGIGWRLWPSYYGSSYWLNDPWHYRLPPAYGPYRWVRYHHDALLVNIYTGRVVDVEYNVFW